MRPARPRGAMARRRRPAGVGRGRRALPAFPPRPHRCPRSASCAARRACVLAGLARGRGRSVGGRACRVRGSRPAALLLGAAWAFLLAVGLAYTLRLRVSGDEPHYLLMAQSLWRERRPRPARQLRARGLARVHAGPDRARTTARRARTAGPTRPTAPACRCCWRPLYALGGRPLCVAVAGPGRGGAGAARSCSAGAPRSPATTRPRSLAWAAAARARPSSFYSFHVYTEVPSARWPSPSRSVSLLAGAGRRRARRPPALLASRPALAARQDDPGRGRAGRRGRCCACAGARALAFLAVAARDGAPASSPTTTRSSAWPRRSPSTAACPADARRLAAARARRPAPRPLVRPAAVRAGLPARARRRWPRSSRRRALGARAPRGARPCWRRCCRGGCGGAGSARPRASWCPLVPVLAVALAARRGLARTRARALALAAARPRRRDCARHDRRDPGALLLLNRGDRPTRLWAALSGDGRVGDATCRRWSPRRADECARRGRLAGRARGAAGARRARRAARDAGRRLLPRAAACPRAAAGDRRRPSTTGPGGAPAGTARRHGAPARAPD